MRFLFSLSMTNPYPMMKGAGLFVLLVGLGITLGGLLGEKYVVRMLIAGGIFAVLSQIVRIRGLTDFPGTPSRTQLYILGAGILFEVVLIALVIYMIRERSRKFWLWILLVVGLHFIILSFAQGPSLLWLGVLSMANAVIGLWLTNTSYLRFWVIDGLLKVTVGAWMLYSG